MGSLIQNTVFGKKKYKPNTFIGGVAASLNTPALVATRLGIPVTRIKSFGIIENDIQFAVIGGTYVIPNGAFRDNLSITSFDDQEGLVTSISSQGFRYASNLTFINFPNITSISSYVFQSSKISGVINFTKCTTIDTDSFQQLLGSANISFPVLTSIIGTNIFVRSSSSTIINVPLSFMTSNGGKPDSNLSTPLLGLVTINYIGYVPDTSYNTEIGGVSGTFTARNIAAFILGIGSGALVNLQTIGGNIRFKILDDYTLKGGAFQGSNSITFFDDSIQGYVKNVLDSAFNNCSVQWVKLYGITNITGNSVLRDSPSVTSFEMPNLLTFSSSYFGRNCVNFSTISFPNVTDIASDSAFYGDANSIKNFYLPNCTKLGTTAGQTSVFYLSKTGGTITVKSNLQTNNAGNPDGDLQYAISRGTNVNYIP
jgi:hypothetical protein